MIRAAGLWIAAVALAVPGAADARAPRPAATVSDGDAADLVALLVPEDRIADLATGLIGTRAERDPATRTLHARYPGLKAHVAERLQPRLLKILRHELPSLQRDIAGIVAMQMTPGEIAESASFFTSPAGRKVYANVLQAISQNANRNQADATQAVLTAAFANVALRDYPAVAAFTTSSAAGKILAINPQIAAASRAWTDRLIAKNGEKLDKLTQHATREFVKKAERTRRT